MTQWLSGQKDEFTPVEINSTSESILTNEHLQKIIFDRPQLDLDQWRRFLQTKLFSIFDNDHKLKQAFEDFEYTTKKFGKSLLEEKVSPTDVHRAMKSLISGNLMDDYRKKLLSKMQSDENAVIEFASSLTLMISDLADWKWPVEGVRGIFRRNLVGRYRCFYEEDFLTAIFLEHLGLKWSYHFKEELKILFDQITKKSQKNCSSRSIQYERLMIQRDEYWMTLLPDKSQDESTTASYENMDKLDSKSKLFYLINVEIQLHQVLQPDKSFTVASADLEWFGPSVSHEIVQIFLQFCGVSQVWLDFFDRFLKQPVYYKPGEPIRQRQRGVPISHAFSHLFSELLLFGLDLYVYQTTDVFLYRFHDDIWFFDSQSSKIEQAWTLMNEYAQLTGLKFNEEKCGSVRIVPSNATDELSTDVVLPCKDVKWGLLTLQSSGRFVIKQETIKPFLDELKVRLTKASTVLEWINLYNQYIAFFMRNFGKCANILGTYHIEQITEIFQFIHQYVFPETNGNACTILTNRIIEQFPGCLNNEICEAWLYWPLTQGGLGLKNIYLTLYSFQAHLLSAKVTTFNQLPVRDAELYAELVEQYETVKKRRKFKDLQEFLHDDETLITFDEYIQVRETRLSHWTQVYIDMINIIPGQLPIMTDKIKNAMFNFQDRIGEISSNKRSKKKKTNDCYLEWLVGYYAGQIESAFNQLDFIDRENLPIGLITRMKTTKIDWNQESKDLQ